MSVSHHVARGAWVAVLLSLAVASPAAARTRLFAPSSPWNHAVPASAPLDAASATLVSRLAAEARHEAATGVGPWIATGVASTPIYRVGRRQRRVRVRLDDPSAPGRRSLQRALAAVPIPARATPAAGPDRHMTIWQPSTDRLWELWQARRETDGWRARWGGAIRHVSRSPGYYTRASWPGAQPYWGATGSGLPVAAGVVRER
ncbi:MAG TPA: hypothetical protein VH418_01385, partial [Solirubrobacteraceae bacterium]